MFRGVYTATSGMIASQRKQQMLSNNLANAQTPGYKADQTVLRAFPDVLIERIRDAKNFSVQGQSSIPGREVLGVLHSGVYAQEAIPSFQQGALQETGQRTDLAIVDQSLPTNPETGQRGHLFFAVQTAEDETRYTRNGQFTVDPQGFLTNSEGHYVLNEDMERIQLENSTFKILEDGRILTDPQEANPFFGAQRLWVGYTEQPERMAKEGNGLYRWIGTQEGQPQSVATIDFLNNPNNPDEYPFQIKQGFIERSNVDATQTMTEMMTSYRQYEANQKVLQAYDRSMEKVANEVGRVF